MSRDPWQYARKRLFESLQEVCDELGKDLKELVPQEGQTIVDNGVISSLQERAARADRLFEENARLAEELENRRQAATEAKDIEEQWQRFSTPARTRCTGHAGEAWSSSPKRPSSSKGLYTPGSMLLSSPAPQVMEVQESDDVSYQALAEKYNKLSQNFKELKTARNVLHDALAKSRVKNREWNAYCDSRDKLIIKKDDKIARLAEEVQALNGRIQELEESTHFDQFGAKLSQENHEKSSVQLKDVQKLQNFISLGLFRHGSNVLTRDDLVRYLCDHDVEDLVYENEEDVVGKHHVVVAEGAISSSKIQVKSEPLSQGNFEDIEEPQLPRLLDASLGACIRFQGGTLGVVEEHDSSTTQGTSPLPANPGDSLNSVQDGNPSGEPPLSPGIPVVVSSRSIRKRKRSSDTAEATPESRIKTEHNSSSPMGLAALRFEESLDLDEIGNKVNTPRKRRLKLARSSQAASSQTAPRGTSQTANCSSTIHYTQVDSYNPSVTCKAASALITLTTNKQVLPRTSLVKPAKQKRSINDKAVADISEDGENTPPTSFPRRGQTNTPDAIQRLESLLVQPSPAKQCLSPVRPAILGMLQRQVARSSLNSGLANELGQIDHSHGAVSRRDRRLHILTEPTILFSGDTSISVVEMSSNSASILPETERQSRFVSRRSATPSLQNGQVLGHSTRQSSSQGSRDVSLEPARPDANPTALQSSSYSSKQPRGEPVANPNFSRLAPAGGGTPSTRKHQQLHFKERIFRSEVAPEHEPLRIRPVDSLSIEDFKINPHFNQGYKFAFSDVVRAKASRKCLPGCTKPECCGNKFRALAEVQRNPHDPLTLSQEETDTRLLSEFMGDNSHKLRNMSKVERDEVLLQARTRELAKKHGKHRHAFERRKSPPGFWRTDFPTTQEENADKEQAKEFERQLVAQRYEEAMRPGGAFMFRDE